MTTVSDSTIRALPLRLARRGCWYEQVQRGALAAIYSLRYDQRGPIIGYDVMKLRVRPASRFGDREITAHEVWPSDEDHGRTAWSVTTLAQAQRRFAMLEGAQATGGMVIGAGTWSQS